MKLSPMHKNLNTRVVGEANLGRKAPMISKLVGPVPGTHYLCNLDTLSSVLNINNTISSSSRTRSFGRFKLTKTQFFLT